MKTLICESFEVIPQIAPSQVETRISKNTDYVEAAFCKECHPYPPVLLCSQRQPIAPRSYRGVVEERIGLMKLSSVGKMALALADVFLS